jgi:hypothetical protein
MTEKQNKLYTLAEQNGHKAVFMAGTFQLLVYTPTGTLNVYADGNRHEVFVSPQHARYMTRKISMALALEMVDA